MPTRDAPSDDAPSERLFVYGTLRCPACQERVFGRSAVLQPDTLVGWRRDKVRLGRSLYPIAYAAAGRVLRGYAIEVTPAELERIDRYETDAYKRSRVRLASGRDAWLYHG